MNFALPLRTQEDYLFDHLFFGNLANKKSNPVNDTLKVNVYENKNSFKFIAECPGLKQDEIKIEYMDDHLTLSSITGSASKQEEYKILCEEIKPRQFSRSFQLKTPIDEESIKATLRDGILEIELPKSSEPRPKVINIQS